MLESLLCGTPVIAHKEAGGIQEIADLAHPGSVKVTKDMNSFIQELTAYKDAQQIKCSLPNIFSLEEAVANLEELFQEITKPQSLQEFS